MTYRAELSSRALNPVLLRLILAGAVNRLSTTSGRKLSRVTAQPTDAPPIRWYS